jgi:hypothetical protein
VPWVFLQYFIQQNSDVKPNKPTRHYVNTPNGRVEIKTPPLWVKANPGPLDQGFLSVVRMSTYHDRLFL